MTCENRCGSCQFWVPEDATRGSLAVAVWGDCTVGHDPIMRLSGRKTTDRGECSAWAPAAAIVSTFSEAGKRS